MFGLFPSAEGAGLPIITRVIFGSDTGDVGAETAAIAVGAGAAAAADDVESVEPCGAAAAAGCCGATAATLEVVVLLLLSPPLEQAATKTKTMVVAAINNHARFELKILFCITVPFDILNVETRLHGRNNSNSSRLGH